MCYDRATNNKEDKSMELKQQFEQVMGSSVNMALATCVNDKPNVRIVTFAYDKNRAGKLYFSTFKGNQKIAEFAQNPNVSCMPLPEARNPICRSVYSARCKIRYEPGRISHADCT